jgi:exopolysaccharide production protein ExoZ
MTEAIILRLHRLYEVSANSSRSIPMEGVRGLAVLLVFFVHYDAIFSGYLIPHSGLSDVFTFLGVVGNTGVDLFFILSGYLIYGTLLRKRVPYVNFIKRRVERIYPAFLCVFCLYIAASAALPGLSKIHGPVLSGAALIASNILLLPGIFHITPIVTVAWSLSYEFFFYLTIPLFVWYMRMGEWRRRRRVIFFASVWLGYLVYSFTVNTSHVRLLMFISGIVLYETIASGLCKSLLRKGIGDILAATVFVGSLVLAYALNTHNWLPLPARMGNSAIFGGMSIEGPYMPITVGLGFFPFVLFCIGGPGPLARAFSWAPVRYLGNMSYSFYLLHGATLNALFLLLHAFSRPDGNSPIVFCALLPVAFALSWLTSTVLFALIEKPVSLRAQPAPTRVTLGQRANEDISDCPKRRIEPAVH